MEAVAAIYVPAGAARHLLARAALRSGAVATSEVCVGTLAQVTAAMHAAGLNIVARITVPCLRAARRWLAPPHKHAVIALVIALWEQNRDLNAIRDPRDSEAGAGQNRDQNAIGWTLIGSQTPSDASSQRKWGVASDTAYRKLRRLQSATAIGITPVFLFVLLFGGTPGYLFLFSITRAG